LRTRLRARSTATEGRTVFAASLIIQEGLLRLRCCFGVQPLLLGCCRLCRVKELGCLLVCVMSIC